MRTSGIAGSRRLGITDEVLALDLDNAVALVLTTFDNEWRATDAKLIAYEVSKMFGDGEGGDDDDNPEYV